MELEPKPYIYVVNVDGKSESYYTDYDTARSAMEKRASELAQTYRMDNPGYIFHIEHIPDGSINLVERNSFLLISYDSIRHRLNLGVVNRG